MQRKSKNKVKLYEKSKKKKDFQTNSKENVGQDHFICPKNTKKKTK